MAFEQSIWIRKKKRKTSATAGNNLFDLPDEVMLNILSRLPAGESILQCRRVCKSWRYLPILDNKRVRKSWRYLPILDNKNYFADMHLQQFQRDYVYHPHHNKVSFVFLGPGNSLYYVEYDENEEQSYCTQKRINLPLPVYLWSVVGSSNGLICLSEKFDCYVYDPVYICNPITKEFVHLPRFNLNKKQKIFDIACGFGYSPTTNEYKVVRIQYNSYEQCVGKVQVYTLGSGIGWRNTGEVNQSLSDTGILLNGTLHWISDEGNIVAFDLAEEKFSLLPTPPCSSRYWYLDSKILVLGGWLCTVMYQRIASIADIWLLKKKEKQSTSTGESDDAMKEEVYQPWSWNREFTIGLNETDWRPQPLAITKSGEILLLYNEKTVVRCDPKTTQEPKTLADLDKYVHDSHPISHFNSFVSLKALGENAKEIMRS